MTQWLKQSVAATVAIGPFVDSTDGVTAETALTISQADVRLSKNGGTFAQKGDATAATHMENGYYSCPLSTTDTGTLGRLRVAVNESGALPVWQDFMVLPAVVYDALVAGTDNLDVMLVATTHTGAVIPTVSTLTGHTAQTGDAFARLGAPAGASISADIAAIEAQTDDIGAAGAGLTAIPWNAAWDAEVQSEVADALGVYDPPTHAELTAEIDAVQTDIVALNDPTVAEIADGVWDEVLSGHLTSGTTGAALNGAGSAGDPWTTALPGAYGAGTAGNILGTNLDAAVSTRASQTSVDTVDDLLDTEVAAIKTDTAAIKVKTDQLTFTTALRIDAQVKGMDSDTVDAVALDLDAGQEIADRLIARNIAGGSDTGRTVGEAFATIRNKIEISGTTLTVYATDDVTPLYTATITRTAGDPLSAVDPA